MRIILFNEKKKRLGYVLLLLLLLLLLPLLLPFLWQLY